MCAEYQTLVGEIKTKGGSGALKDNIYVKEAYNMNNSGFIGSLLTVAVPNLLLGAKTEQNVEISRPLLSHGTYGGVLPQILDYSKTNGGKVLGCKHSIMNYVETFTGMDVTFWVTGKTRKLGEVGLKTLPFHYLGNKCVYISSRPLDKDGMPSVAQKMEAALTLYVHGCRFHVLSAVYNHEKKTIDWKLFDFEHCDAYHRIVEWIKTELETLATAMTDKKLDAHLPYYLGAINPDDGTLKPDNDLSDEEEKTLSQLLDACKDWTPGVVYDTDSISIN